MKASIQAFRALPAIVFQRIFTPIIWIVGACITAILLLTVYLGGWVHPMWWLLLVIITPATLVVVAITAAVWYLSTRLIPRPLTPSERSQLNDAADKVMRVAEVRATPLPWMFVLIAKDVIRGKNSSYLETVVNDTTSLKQTFLNIRALFEVKNLSDQ